MYAWQTIQRFVQGCKTTHADSGNEPANQTHRLAIPGERRAPSPVSGECCVSCANLSEESRPENAATICSEI